MNIERTDSGPGYASGYSSTTALEAASAFTYTVERFMRSGDGSDQRTPPTEAEVAEALYALRALIAKANRSTK